MEAIKELIEELRKQHEAQMEAQQKVHEEEMKAQAEQMKAQAEHMKTQAGVQQKGLDELLRHLAEASTPAVPATSVPSFAPFDPTSELWRQYLDRFTIFAGANSIPNEKLAHVFLTNQTSATYQLLDNLAGQQDPPIPVKDLSMDQIQGFMQEHFDPARFVIQERYNYWSSPARRPGESPNELAARLRKAAATCDFCKEMLDDSLRTDFVCKINNEAVLKACFQRKPDELMFAKAVALANEI